MTAAKPHVGIPRDPLDKARTERPFLFRSGVEGVMDGGGGNPRIRDSIGKWSRVSGLPQTY